MFEHELKNAYIGEVIECDFTQSDYWFTYYSRLYWSESYWRWSSWLYVSNTWNYWWVWWSVPSSIYSKWILKKAVFTFKSSFYHHWGWFSLKSWNWIDQYMIRYFGSLRVKYANQNNSGTSAIDPPTNTNRTFTVDFENKILSSSVTWSETLALDNNTITAFNNDWSNWNININAIFADGSNVTVYIPKIIFYF